MHLDEYRSKLQADRRITLSLKVIPKSSKNEIAGILEDGTIKLKITAAPERGKANAAIIEFLSEQFGVSKRQIEIIRGDTSPLKTVLITA
jgi:uncharacterized protein (TIGR00251 family)